MPFGFTWRNIFKTFGGVAAGDDFNRTNGSLGTTPTGGLPWQVLSGTWSISSNKAYTSTSQYSDPIAVVDTGGSDVDISLNVASGGGDALYFRVVDANNWWRIRQRYYSQQDPYSCPTYCTQYEYQATHGFGLYSAQSSPCDGAHTHSWNNYYWCSSMSCCASSSFSHSHTIYIKDEGCSWGYSNYSHSHSPVWSCSYTGNTSSYQCGTTTCYTTNYYYVTYLEHNVGGTVSQAQTIYGVGPNTFRVLAVGNSIRWFVNGVERASATSSVHQNATKHGIGRGASELSSTSLDNFSLTPKD